MKSKNHHEKIVYLLEELQAEGLVKLTEITPKTKGIPKDYLAEITPKGIYFFEFEGGHSKIYRQIILKTSWTIAVTMAAISNAVIIIVIAFLGLSKEDVDLEKIENQIDSLKTQHMDTRNTLDSLIQQKPDSTKN